MATTIRISASSHEILKEASRISGRSMQAVLDEAVEHYRRQRFIRDVNAAFARVREDPKEWDAMRTECEAWDGTITDGLDDE